MLQKDPVARAAYNATYYDAHKAQRAAYNADYYVAHKEQRVAYVAAWRAANKGVDRENATARMSKWRAQHPVRSAALGAASNANRAASKYGVSGLLVADDIERLWNEQPTCHACGAEVLGIDHIVAMANGGANTPDNLQTMCPPCNAKKGTTPCS